MVGCADPVLCYLDSTGKRIFRNFSFVKKVFFPRDPMVVDCGKCLYCRREKAKELAMCCVLHSSLYFQNCFLTLTYDESLKGYHNVYDRSDVQKFKKKLRQFVYRSFGRRIEIFDVHEYGRNGKKHWHLIVFNWSPSDRVVFTIKDQVPLYTSRELSRLWKHGFSTVGDVSEASAMYQAKYMEKDFQLNQVTSNKKSHSFHRGIGQPWFLENFEQVLKLGYIPFQGQKRRVPRKFEKIAHKHWAWFYDQSYFLSSDQRKRRYTPFHLATDVSIDLADLYPIYEFRKSKRVEELKEKWSEVISQYLTSSRDPDFVKSSRNALHDLVNKSNLERF